MGHLDGRLVAEVYSKWLKPSNARPGQSAATVYASEWSAARSLVELKDPKMSEEEARQEEAELVAAGDIGDDGQPEAEDF